MTISNIGILKNGLKTSELLDYLQKHLERHGDTTILMNYCDEDDEFWVRFYHFKEGDKDNFYILPEQSRS